MSRGKTKRPVDIQSDTLEVAVLSDLHAYEAANPDSPPSHFCITNPPLDPIKNPIAALVKLIEGEKIRADVLMCAGDIGDKAHPVAIQYAWEQIHKIGKTLETKLLVASTGNHDVDSRYSYNNFDAKGMLQNLEPPYPFDSEELNDRYWSRHFVIIRNNCFRLLVINSSAFHGEGQYGETKKYEFEHGRISEHTLAAIRKALEGSETPPINIALCHHHPHQHSELRLGEEDLMRGGQELLRLLGTGDYGTWLIVHGHKHHPKIENAAGGASSPIVFAAGSLCANLHLELQTAARNQFYILSLPHTKYSTHGFVGRFKSWDWLCGHGWVTAQDASGLPASGGFGWRGDVRVLARKIASQIPVGSMRWEDLRRSNEELDFLLPTDLLNLRKCLERGPKLIIEPEKGCPVLIGRSP